MLFYTYVYFDLDKGRRKKYSGPAIKRRGIRAWPLRNKNIFSGWALVASLNYIKNIIDESEFVFIKCDTKFGLTHPVEHHL